MMTKLSLVVLACLASSATSSECSVTIKRKVGAHAAEFHAVVGAMQARMSATEAEVAALRAAQDNAAAELDALRAAQESAAAEVATLRAAADKAAAAKLESAGAESGGCVKVRTLAADAAQLAADVPAFHAVVGAMQAR